MTDLALGVAVFDAALGTSALAGLLVMRAPGAACALGLAALALPLAVPPQAHFWRAFDAVFSMMPLLKTVQAASDPTFYGPGFRVWQFVSIFDARRVRRVRPGPTVGLTLSVGLHGATFVAAWWALDGQRPGPSLASLSAWAWAWGLVAVISMVSGLTEATRWAYAWAGIDVPSIQRRPFLAASMHDFWSRRWNRTVSDWLQDRIFRPCARRGHPALAVWLSFAFSALIHVYIVIVSAGPLDAARMGAFFLLQAPLVLIDRRLTKARRPFAWLGLLATSPLFIHPYLRLLLP